MKKNIDILHVTQAAYGGIDLYIRMILKYSSNTKLLHKVACPGNYGTLKDSAKEYNIQYWNIDFVREISPVSDLKSVLKLIGLLKATRPDLVHLHSSKAGALGRICCKLLNIPYIYTPHGYSNVGENGAKSYLYKFIEIVLAKITPLTLCTSKSERDIAHNIIGVSSQNLKFFMNSVEIMNLNGGIEKSHYILMVGRVNYYKNPEMFVRVASLLSKKDNDLRYVLLGTGLHDDKLYEIKSMIRHFNLSENFMIHPWVNKNEVYSFMRKAKVVVVPSRAESFGYVAAEAGMCGTPVVATNAGGLNDVIIDKQTGYLVDIDDDMAMTRRIEILLEDDVLRVQMGNAARKHISENFDIQKNIHKLENIYLDFYSKYGACRKPLVDGR